MRILWYNKFVNLQIQLGLSMIIKKMLIEKFRKMENLEINFGGKLTFIAGGNGTYKTSLLGLIGNSFVFTDKETRQPIAKTIMDDEYRAWLKDIHHFTKYDNVEEMKHTLFLTNKFQNKELYVKGFYRKEAGKPVDPTKYRFVVGKTREKGEGHFILPVIYLGLKRLVPIGEHNKNAVQVLPLDLPDNEVQEYEKIYNEIQDRILFKLPQQTSFKIEKVITNNKEMIGGHSNEYDSRGLSAGQDNVSQIATAIASFAKLKREQGNNYKGGIILIDEIESTLHPSALRRLLMLLCEYSDKYLLQIIATTHSLDVLKFALETKYKSVSKIAYITKSRGKLEICDDWNFSEIKQDMTARLEEKRNVKIPLYCEDKEAECFLNNILEDNIKKDIKIIPVNNNYGFLEKVADSVIAEKQNAIFILDGEQPQNKENKRIMVLPGGASPEALMYRFLANKAESDNFFKRPNLNKEMYLGDYPIEPTNRDCFKTFFYSLKNNISIHTPRKIICAWRKENKDIVKDFNDRLRKKVNLLLLNT